MEQCIELTDELLLTGRSESFYTISCFPNEQRMTERPHIRSLTETYLKRPVVAKFGYSFRLDLADQRTKHR